MRAYHRIVAAALGLCMLAGCAHKKTIKPEEDEGMNETVSTQFGVPLREGENRGGYSRTPDFGELPDEFYDIVANGLMRKGTAWRDCFISAERGADGETRSAVFKRYDFSGRLTLSAEAECGLNEDISCFPTSDGGLLLNIAVDAYDESVEPKKALLRKLGPAGQVQWELTLVDENYDTTSRFAEVGGEYFLFGNRPSESGPDDVGTNWDVSIIKIDAEGRLADKTLIGGSDYDFLEDVRPCDDGVELFVASDSHDGFFEGRADGKQGRTYWRIKVSPSLELEPVSREDGPADEMIGWLGGRPVTVKELSAVTKEEFSDHVSSVIDYGDRFMTVSFHATGMYPHQPPIVSSMWLYVETVYRAYSSDGRLLWQRAIDVSPDYDSIRAQYEERYPGLYG